MADHAPAAKRAKREKFMFDSSSSDDDDDSVIKNMEMDTTDISDIYTSDNSEDGSFLQSSKRGDGEKLNRKPFVLKVPRGKASVPESVKHPGSALVSDKRKNSISPEQFRALSMMPLDNMCMFAEVSKSFKELALKFFPMKYRNMNLAALANPTTGKYTLESVRRLLRIFGDIIWSLDLSLDMLDDPKGCVELVALVRNHCAETLGWLSI